MFDISFNEALKSGEPEAYKKLFRLIYPRMKGYCKLFVHSPDDVEDIIQDCFLILWEKRSSIITDKSVESYLFVTLRNRCLNYLKEMKLKEGLIKPETPEISELQYLYQLDFHEKEELSLEEQLIISLNNVVEKLPPRIRDVFTQCKIEGRKQKEVAEELGISIKAIEKYISEAKKRISKKLLQQYPMLAIIITMWLK